MSSTNSTRVELDQRERREADVILDLSTPEHQHLSVYEGLGRRKRRNEDSAKPGMSGESILMSWG